MTRNDLPCGLNTANTLGGSIAQDQRGARPGGRWVHPTGDTAGSDSGVGPSQVHRRASALGNSRTRVASTGGRLPPGRNLRASRRTARRQPPDAELRPRSNGHRRLTRAHQRASRSAQGDRPSRGTSPALSCDSRSAYVTGGQSTSGARHVTIQWVDQPPPSSLWREGGRGAASVRAVR